MNECPDCGDAWFKPGLIEVPASYPGDSNWIYCMSTFHHQKPEQTQRTPLYPPIYYKLGTDTGECDEQQLVTHALRQILQNEENSCYVTITYPAGYSVKYSKMPFN